MTQLSEEKYSTRLMDTIAIAGALGIKLDFSTRQLDSESSIGVACVTFNLPETIFVLDLIDDDTSNCEHTLKELRAALALR